MTVQKAPYEKADRWVRAGENEKASVWLEKAYAEKSNFVTKLKSAADYGSLRSDPRYRPVETNGAATNDPGLLADLVDSISLVVRLI